MTGRNRVITVNDDHPMSDPGEDSALPGSVLDAVSLPEVPGGSWGGVLLGVLTVAVIASVESLLSAVPKDLLVHTSWVATSTRHRAGAYSLTRSTLTR
ncbi:MAG: hypothetical protein JO287_21765 [Pseudonocardiales bacterium]|nr:hypothetical protein [Pseudonocardiales bacterium]